MKYSPLRSGGWWRAPVKNCRFYEVAGTIELTAECVRFSVRGCRKQKEIRKQDQIGILAQNILLCGKLRLEFFRE
jgi:hypothetical protein